MPIPRLVGAVIPDFSSVPLAAFVPLQRFVFISFNFVVAVLLLNLVVASFLEYQVP